MKTPNWNKIANRTVLQELDIRSKDYHEILINFYRQIVNNPDRDNSEIVSIWLNYCDEKRSVKEEFFMWASNQHEDRFSQGMKWMHVLQFLNYMTIQLSLAKNKKGFQLNNVENGKI